MYPEEGNECKFLMSADGSQLLGFSFGSDFTTEHECGIADIREAFGVCKMDWYDRSSDHLTGIDRRKITKLPSRLYFTSSVGQARIQFNTTRNLEVGKDYYLKRKTRSAWSDEAFVINSCSPDDVLLLRLWDHILNLDVIFTMQAEGLSSGLTILVASAISKEDAWNWKASDQEEIALRIEAGPILKNLHEVLGKAGKSWFALHTPHKIQGQIRFWLNPMQQHIHNCGWFTPDELLLWATDQGPVMKEKKVAEKPAKQRKKRK
jgi:hypothetical protein